MAYRVSQYTTENFATSSRVYSTIIGLQIPFAGVSPSGSSYGADAVFNSNFTTRDQIRSNIVNFLLTDQGEIYMNTQYGSSLRRYIFSNITNESYTFSKPGFSSFTNLGVEDLQANIKADLSANFPLITVNQVTITPLYDSNTVSIDVNYTFSGSEEVLNMAIA
jgi:hypothetical protein